MSNHLYSSNNARRSLTDTIAFRALSQVSTALGYVVLVRAIAKRDFGILSLLYAVIPIVGTIASLGLEQILRRFQPEYLRAGNYRAAEWLVRVISSWRLGTNITALAAILLAWNLVAPIFKLGDQRSTFVLFCPLIILYFQLAVVQLALASHMRHRFSVGSIALLSVIKLVAYASLSLSHTLTLRTVIITDTIAYGLGLASMRWAYRHVLRGMGSPQGAVPDSRERRRLIRYGIFNNFNDAGVLLMYSTVDTFMIAAFIDTVSVGIYSFYSRVRQMVLGVLPGNLLGNVIQPLFFSIPRASADQKIPQYFSFLLNMELLLLWPALAFSVAYHNELVQVVFDGKFGEYSRLLPILFAFGMINAFSDAVTLVAQYEERPGVMLTSKLFVIYNFAAMAVLVPLLGIFGAAVASGTAQLMKNLFIWWFVRHRAVWNNAWQALMSGILLWGGATVACLLVKRLVSASPLVQIIFGVLILGGAGLIYVRGPAVSAADRSILSSLADGRQAVWLRRVGVLKR